MEKDDLIPEPLDEPTNHDELVLDDDAERTVVVEQLPLGFGNPNDVAAVPNTELEANEVFRGVDALEFLDNQQRFQEPALDGFGANFAAVPHLFANLQDQNQLLQAPELPSWLEPAPTSYRSSKPLEGIRKELESTFEAQSIHFEQSEDYACGYSCSSKTLNAVTEFDVCIFRASGDQHLIELRHQSGCRYSFSQTVKTLAGGLGVSFLGQTGAPRAMPFAPPPLPADFAMPTLSRSEALSKESETCSSLQTAMGDGLRSSRLQGARAFSSLAGSFDESAFVDGGFGLGAAKKLMDLAKSDDNELRSVSFGGIASLAAMPAASSALLSDILPLVASACKDEDAPHAKREVLRAAQSLASREKAFAAALVRAGVVEALEAEAGGADGCRDIPAMAFARSALAACRA